MATKKSESELNRHEIRNLLRLLKAIRNHEPTEFSNDVCEAVDDCGMTHKRLDGLLRIYSK